MPNLSINLKDSLDRAVGGARLSFIPVNIFDEEIIAAADDADVAPVPASVTTAADGTASVSLRESPPDTYYRMSVRKGRETFTRGFAMPDGDAELADLAGIRFIDTPPGVVPTGPGFQASPQQGTLFPADHTHDANSVFIDSRIAGFARAHNPSGTIPDARVPNSIARTSQVPGAGEISNAARAEVATWARARSPSGTVPDNRIVVGGRDGRRIDGRGLLGRGGRRRLGAVERDEREDGDRGGGRAGDR